jgi:hypothetical protein
MKTKKRTRYDAAQKPAARHHTQELSKLLHISPSLHKKLKGYCVDNGKSLREVTERIIKDFLGQKPRIY